MNLKPTAAILVIVVVSLIVSGLSMCGVWELRRVEGTNAHQRSWAWFTILFNLIVVGASFGVLGWASVIQGREGWEGYEDIGLGGEFTRETWVCQIDHFYPRQSWAGHACGFAVSAYLRPRVIHFIHTNRE